MEYGVHEDCFVMSCGHMLNRECAAHCFKADIQNVRTFPRCPECLAANQTTLITENELTLVLDQKIMDHYYQLSLQIGANELGDIFQCPTANCPFFAQVPDDLERFNCSKCGFATCVKCKKAFHRNETCEQYKKRKCKEEALSEKQLAELAKKMGWKPCPRCKVYVERTFGCKHMKCGNAQCKCEFCDICGDELDTEKWQEHFNPPNKCRLWASEADLLYNDEQKTN
eukprot:218970_1